MLADLAPAEADVVIERVLHRVLAALSEPIDVGAGVPFVVHASIGVSRFPQDSSDAETLMRHADAAMYRAKRAAPGGYRLYVED
jgi:GGDEF domain-containing protein